MIVSLTILHVTVAAVWFGHKFLVVPDLGRSLSTEEQARGLLVRLRRAERLGIVTGVGTLVSGLLLAGVLGFSEVAPTIYLGLALVVVAFGIGGTVGAPASKRLFRAISEGDLEGGRAAARMLSAALGMEGLLWIGALATMLW